MKLDDYHYHEMIDRLYVINDMIGQHIELHPIYEKHKRLRKFVDNATEQLANAYQLTGNLRESNKIKLDK